MIVFSCMSISGLSVSVVCGQAVLDGERHTFGGAGLEIE
jgi:hypothetical protein